MPDVSADEQEFRSLLAESEDVQRFNDYLRQHRSTADVLHVAMRRMDGSRFDAEIFIIKFEGLNARSRYLLGIRATSMEEPSELFINKAVLHTPRDASLTIATTRGYPVVGSSSKFRRILQHEAGCNLNRLLHVTPELEGYIQEAFNAFYGKGQTAPSHKLRVRLRTHGPQVVQADCCAVKPSGHDGESEPAGLALRLIFDNFEASNSTASGMGRGYSSSYSSSKSRSSTGSRRLAGTAGTPVHVVGKQLGTTSQL